MRLFQTRDLQVDESALTGESVPVDKKPDVLDHDIGLADRRTWRMLRVWSPTGRGAALSLPLATRRKSDASLNLSRQQRRWKPADPKDRQIQPSPALCDPDPCCPYLRVGLMRGQSAFDMFMAAVALAVGAIPEGLPAALTITLAIGVARMASKRAIIRKLTAVETLGSTTVICSDKTGTLTENQMTVQEILAGGERFEVTGAGYTPSGRILRQGVAVDASGSPVLMECLKAGLLCNDSLLLEKEGRWVIQGDPTEGALLVSAVKAGLDMAAVRRDLPRIDAIPFESQHQYMAALHDDGTDKPGIIYVKGSVETILEKCVSYLDSTGRPAVLDAEQVHKSVEEMAARGMRVLAFAKGEIKQATTGLNHPDVASGMTFLGLQGMIDPPRQEAILAVQKCHTAGIRVKMITGDHALTASSIAAAGRASQSIQCRYRKSLDGNIRQGTD